MVAKAQLEPLVEPVFHPDSYAYRPGKSAADGRRASPGNGAGRYDWVVDVDIKASFDNIDHALMLHAVRKHTDCKMAVTLYRTLVESACCSMQVERRPRVIGNSQGGVNQPLLANLFLPLCFRCVDGGTLSADPFGAVCG